MTDNEQAALDATETLREALLDLTWRLRSDTIAALEATIPRVLRDDSTEIVAKIASHYDLNLLQGTDRAAANAMVAFVGATDQQVQREIDMQRGDSPVFSDSEQDAALDDLRMRAAGYVSEADDLGTVDGLNLAAELSVALDRDPTLRSAFLSFIRVTSRNGSDLWPEAQSDIQQMRTNPSLARHISRAVPVIDNTID